MNYVIFDTETTGLGSKDEVLQFCGVVTNAKLEVRDVINFYCYSQVETSAEAERLHGLTPEFLWRASGGKALEDQVEKYLREVVRMSDVTWVEYSSNGFDRRKINQTLKQNGAATINFGESIAMAGRAQGVYNFSLYNALRCYCFGGKSCKLSQAVATLPYSEEKIDSMYVAAMKHFNCMGNGKFHDASYDAFVSWLLFSYYSKRLGIQ